MGSRVITLAVMATMTRPDIDEYCFVPCLMMGAHQLAICWLILKVRNLAVETEYQNWVLSVPDPKAKGVHTHSLSGTSQLQ